MREVFGSEDLHGVVDVADIVLHVDLHQTRVTMYVQRMHDYPIALMELMHIR